MHTTNYQTIKDIESSTDPIFFYKFQYRAKKLHVFGLASGKIGICGDKIVTRIFEEFEQFSTHEKGTFWRKPTLNYSKGYRIKSNNHKESMKLSC
jgi:hypothetical protein